MTREQVLPLLDVADIHSKAGEGERTGTGIPYFEDCQKIVVERGFPTVGTCSFSLEPSGAIFAII
jgi:hypothetical protein